LRWQRTATPYYRDYGSSKVLPSYEFPTLF
jgi:hypothetical protein